MHSTFASEVLFKHVEHKQNKVLRRFTVYIESLCVFLELILFKPIEERSIEGSYQVLPSRFTTVLRLQPMLHLKYMPRPDGASQHQTLLHYSSNYLAP